MSRKSKKKEWSKSKIVFTAIYIAAFLGAGIIGLFSNSFFAYEAFNSLWADVVYLLCISALYITAFVQELFTSRKLPDIIINFFIFIISWIIFLLMLFSGIAALIAVIYSAAMAAFLALCAVFEVRKGGKPEMDTKQFVCVGSLILFGMLKLTSVCFVNEIYMAWSFIPAAVIFIAVCVTAVVLLREQWDSLFETKAKKISALILSSLMIFFVAYFYSFTAVGIANCVFDGEPVQKEYIVLEKHVSSGSRKVTRFELKVEFGTDEKWINVPVTDYHSVSEGDTILINYHQGAFGFAYLTYAGKD